jgi:hypothetical protein
MRRAVVHPGISYSKSQESGRKVRVGYLLVVLLLLLLPLERLMLPANLRVADFALVLLILYGSLSFWLTEQRIYLPLLLPIWLAGLTHPASIISIVQEVYIFVWFIVLTNILISLSLSNVDRLMKIWSVIALTVAATTVMGMLHIGPNFFYTSPIDGQVLSFGGFSRGLGTYINPNAAAAYLSISFFVLLATDWSTGTRSIFAMCLLLGIFATGSMGGVFSTFIGLVVLVMIYSILKNRQEAMLWGVVVGIGIAIVIEVLYIFSLLPSISFEFGSTTGFQWFSLTLGRLPRSLGSRLTLIESLWPIYNLNPLGTGPDTSALFKGSLHNDYAAFLIERGPLGFIGWMGLVGTTLIAPLRTVYRRTGSYRHWQLLTLWAGFLAIAINALTHEISHFRQVWVLMAFLFAMGYVLPDRSATNLSLTESRQSQTTKRSSSGIGREVTT